MTEQDNILSGEDLYNALNAQDWNKLLPSLYAYAISVLKYKYRIKADSKQLLGKEAVDFVHEAIQAAWEEKRKWNKTVYNEGYDFFTGAIDSIIYNFIVTNFNKRSFIDDDILATLNIPQDGVDKQIVVNEIHAMIKKELDGDIDAELVFDCMVDGMMLPREICVELGISDKEVYNIIKRLRRKKDKIISSFTK